MNAAIHGWRANCFPPVRVRLFGITRLGLGAMMIAVIALWTCIALEASTRRRANADAQISMERLRRLRQDSVPAANPMPWFRSRRPSSS
jgi:hypothetical protein